METLGQSLDSSQSQKFYDIFLDFFGLHLQKVAKRPIKIIKMFGLGLPVYLSYPESDDCKLYMKIDQFFVPLSVVQSEVDSDDVCKKSNLWVPLSIVNLQRLVTWPYDLQIGHAA